MGEELVVPGSILDPTGHICADCGENIRYNDEVWLLQVVQAHHVGAELVHHPVIDENDPEGDFLFDPYFFCFKCWEAMYKSLQEESEDEPPIEDPESTLECVCCGSGIREWEYTGLFTLCELQLSTRAPNRVQGPRVQEVSRPDYLCMYCLVVLNNGFITLWTNIGQCEECADCTQLRCWRTANCGCGCHVYGVEYEEESGEIND